VEIAAHHCSGGDSHQYDRCNNDYNAAGRRLTVTGGQQPRARNVTAWKKFRAVGRRVGERETCV